MAVSVKRIFKRVLLSILLLLLTVTAAGLYLNRIAIQDTFAANSFEASREILDIKESIGLNDVGERIFLATEPAINDRDTFNQICQMTTHSEGGSLLGCYVNGNIHLFRIDDERLEGIMEVTAAHEMLHAAFDRMSTREAEAFQKRVTEYYREIRSENPALVERMSVYKGLSYVRFANELHSVLATEMSELPEWLEHHYSQWFDDRQKVVELFDSYSVFFSKLQAEGADILEKLTALSNEIDVAIDAYSAEVRDFNVQWENFKERNDKFEFAKKPDEFYDIRDSLNEWRIDLESKSRSIENMINKHESLRKELEDLNHVSSDLRHSMDSSLLQSRP